MDQELNEQVYLLDISSQLCFLSMDSFHGKQITSALHIAIKTLLFQSESQYSSVKCTVFEISAEGSSVFLSISPHFRDGVGSVGTSKWIFPPERINPFAAEGETSKAENNATAELNNTDAPDVSPHQQQRSKMSCSVVMSSFTLLVHFEVRPNLNCPDSLRFAKIVRLDNQIC